MIIKSYRIKNILSKVVDNRGRNTNYYDCEKYPIIDNYMIKNELHPALETATRFLSEEQFNTFLRGYIDTDDLLMTLVGNGIGNVTLSPHPNCAIIQNTIGMAFNKCICNQLFLYYYFKTIQTSIRNLDRGSSQPSVNREDIFRIRIQLPEIAVQKRIASILSAYDNLIEVNNKRIKVLEQMAENLYKEWFVRFRFPGHETAEFEDGIPKGWGICRLSSVANVLSGGTPSTEHEEYYGGEIPFYTPKDSAENYFVFDTITTITGEGLKHCNSQLFPKNTIMITARGTVGNLNLLAVPMAMNQSCYALNSDTIHSQFFLFFMIKREIQKLKKMASGGVFDTIIVSTFDHIKVVVPDNNTIDKFNALVSPIMDETNRLLEENKSLIKQRDLLLPRLMSGKLEV